ncbi:oxidoreductase [Paenibacillus sp. sgz500958]|uniref:oxidoreductase n=1 Tax=Paenibacillus sp. sgz500958 TaxID=3242475 RepID=UPI0036D20B22
MARVALVLGATGLVGNEITRDLLGRNEWDEIRVLVRRPLGFEHPKLKQTIIDWGELGRYEDVFSGVAAVFCALGTTIKKAGSQRAFEVVDLDYPLQAAALAKKQGVKQFLVVSSVGANSKSRTFYTRTKGLMEEGLIAADFQGVHIFRPSLLLGERQEFRIGERVAAGLMKGLDFMLTGKGAKYRAIQGKTVARAMINIALAGTRGVHVYSNEVIHVLGKEQNS